MPKRTATIAVDGQLVKWARESAGLSDKALAKKLGIKAPSKVAAWQAPGATADLTVRQLERLADATKRPLAAFFLPEPPREPELPDFRLPPSEGFLVTTSPTLLAIRRARRLQQVFADLATQLGEGPSPRLTFSRSVSPEEAASRAREALGVSVDDQTGWKDTELALKVWRSRLEALGVIVFQFAMPPKEVSGFSLANGIPAIVLNRKDGHARRVFTLFHEWAHLLVGEAGLCAVVEGYGRERDEEVFCNAFAGALLVPMRGLSESGLFVSYRQREMTLDHAAAEGARLFSVSRYVILRRFLTAQLISTETYRRTVDAWGEPRPPKKAKGGAPPYRMAVSELGTRFVSRVLSAHDRGLIEDGDVADYLSLRLKHLERVQELVAVG